MKIKNRKYKKLVVNKYKMDQLETGASEGEVADIETIMEESEYMSSGGVRERDSEQIRTNIRTNIRRDRNEIEFGRLNRERENNAMMENLLSNENIDFVDQTGDEFIAHRRRDIEQMEIEKERVNNEQLKIEYILNLIANNKVYELQSLIESDSFIIVHKDYIFSNQDNPEIRDTFMTYAIKLRRIAIVKLFLANNFYVDESMISLTNNKDIINIIKIYSRNNLTPEEKFIIVNSSKSLEEETIKSSQEIRSQIRQANILSKLSKKRRRKKNIQETSIVQGKDYTKRKVRTAEEQQAIEESLKMKAIEVKKRIREEKQERLNKRRSVSPSLDLSDTVNYFLGATGINDIINLSERIGDITITDDNDDDDSVARGTMRTIPSRTLLSKMRVSELRQLCTN